ncbi:MAG: MBL fold metallo-hydrolase [Ruminococcaceae bacterium]|nr:MBL fold metallo-hydrolase [Oscillospiraceae bacterium]
MPKDRRKQRRRKKHRASTGNPFLFGFLTAVLLFSLVFFINENYLHFESIPTVRQLAQRLGLVQRPDITVEQDEIAVHFIDVGQGDCTLIKTPDKNMLIDCGERTEAATVVAYLRDFGVTRLDYVLVSHQHSDHMGGMAQILRSFEIGEFIMPEIPEDMIPTADFYSDTLDVIEQKGIDAVYAEVGREIALSEGTVLQLIGPVGSDYDDLNSYSVVARLVSGNYSFLFTGDMEKDAEREMTDAWIDIKADVLKVAHHGSSTSSSDEFIWRVRPEYAVFSVGRDNSYGHPTDEVIERIMATGCEMLTTMQYGDIVFVTDGNELKLVTTKGGADAA